MHRRKSTRHQRAANARWRKQLADAERAVGIEDPPMPSDAREPFDLLLSAAGGRDMRIEPRIGYIAWRAVDRQTGAVLHCCALKELLHRVADSLPPTRSQRHAIWYASARDEADAAAQEMMG